MYKGKNTCRTTTATLLHGKQNVHVCAYWKQKCK